MAWHGQGEEHCLLISLQICKLKYLTARQVLWHGRVVLHHDCAIVFQSYKIHSIVSLSILLHFNISSAQVVCHCALGALAWNGDTLSSGSRDRLILQRDIRTPTSIEARLVGHRQEVNTCRPVPHLQNH